MGLHDPAAPRRCRRIVGVGTFPRPVVLVMVVGALTVACRPHGDAVLTTVRSPEVRSPGIAAAATVDAVDWEETTYLSVCGLSRVRVRGGVGEASSLGATYGVEIVDVDLGDLDGDGDRDAAVLVDCLGGDTYRPHVIVVPPSGVLGPDGARLAVAAGGSLPPGGQPVAIDVRAGGRIDVEVRVGGEPVAHTLRYAPDVLIGGELTARPSEVISGVLTGVVDGTAVLAVAPDDGYRLAVPDGSSSADPDTGTVVDLDQVVGRPVAVTVGEGATVQAVEVAPAGGA